MDFPYKISANLTVSHEPQVQLFLIDHDSMCSVIFKQLACIPCCIRSARSMACLLGNACQSRSICPPQGLHQTNARTWKSVACSTEAIQPAMRWSNAMVKVNKTRDAQNLELLSTALPPRPPKPLSLSKMSIKVSKILSGFSSEALTGERTRDVHSTQIARVATSFMMMIRER